MDAPDPAASTRVALLFEGGLGVVAIAIGGLAGHWPLVGIAFGSDEAPSQLAAAAWGLVATAPLLIALHVIGIIPSGPLRRLHDTTAELVLKMFGGASTLQLAIVAMAAGLGEELLFRGLVQAGLSRLAGGVMGPWIALAAASILFGVCHWLNTTYAILAMFAGVYFGLLLIATGSLWTPIIAHAAYDCLALIYLIRPHRLIR